MFLLLTWCTARVHYFILTQYFTVFDPLVTVVLNKVIDESVFYPNSSSDQCCAPCLLADATIDLCPVSQCRGHGNQVSHQRGLIQMQADIVLLSTWTRVTGCQDEVNRRRQGVKPAVSNWPSPPEQLLLTNFFSTNFSLIHSSFSALKGRGEKRHSTLNSVPRLPSHQCSNVWNSLILPRAVCSGFDSSLLWTSGLVDPVHDIVPQNTKQLNRNRQYEKIYLSDQIFQHSCVVLCVCVFFFFLPSAVQPPRSPVWETSPLTDGLPGSWKQEMLKKELF